VSVKFYRFAPVREPIRIYEETRDEWFEPGGYRDLVAVEAWGSDKVIHRQELRTRQGLIEEDSRHLGTLYRTLENELERKMREAGVWEGE
jgi:hypothetical protein